MGGAQSYFNENDWDLADGSLLTCDETMDGRLPTAKYQTYEILKRSIVANQREFDVTDSEKNLLFHVRPSPGTIAGFDVLGIGSANNDDYILRVTVDLARRYWIIYRFDRPVFEGQKPDSIATEKFALEQQQSVTHERKELAARISASLAIHSFSDDTPVENVVPPTPIVPKHLLYKVGCVTVSWSRYMAVAAYYGPPTIEQIMLATEAAYKKELKAKLKSTNDANDTDDDDGDILRAARKIAGRLREEREIMDESERSDKEIAGRLREEREIMDESERSDKASKFVSFTDSNNDPTISIITNEDSCQSPTVVSESKAIPTLNTADEAETMSDVKGDSSPPHDEKDTEVAATNQLDTTKDNTAEIILYDSNDNRKVEHSVLSARHHSLADDLADESESEVDLSNENHHVEIMEKLVRQERLNKNNDTILGNDSLEIQTSASMPELSHTEKPGSPDLITNGLQKWWRESSRALHENTIAKLRPKGTSEDYINSGTPTTDGSIVAIDTSSSSKYSDGGTSNNDSAVGVASFLGIGKNSNADDPLQGVVHLDKPLLLCQEIYTRIIGNHQTSKVSKEKVLTLLRQDMEQHIQKKKDDDEIDVGTNEVEIAVSNDSLTLTQSNDEIHQENTTPSEPNQQLPVVTPSVVEADNVSPVPAGNSSDVENLTNESSNKGSIAAETPTEQHESPKEQPLIGYWAWENTLRTHKMKMHLAKGSDLALHIVLAVLVNQLRYERNAIAIAV